MKTILIAGAVATASCGHVRTKSPPQDRPAPVVNVTAPGHGAPAPPAAAAEPGAVWGDRVERAFVALTVDSVAPAPPRAIASAGWTALGGVTTELPGDDAALASALERRAALAIGGGEVAPERAWAAIAAMTAAADNVHAMFVDGPRMAQLVGSVDGEPFVTPGVVVHRTPDGELVVAEVLAGSSGAKAGLVVGDVITTIDGRAPRRSAPLFDLMFGPAGQRVVLGIRRRGADRAVPVTLEAFRHPVGTHRVLKGGVGVLRLYFCAKGEAPERNQVGVTLAALADLEAKQARRLVIDLRGNMGGAGVAEWASIFTTADPILLSRQRDEPADTPWPRSGAAWTKALSVAVLVDEQTISCGEMLAFALAEHGVARVFGQPTGEALDVPDGIDLGDGHTLLVPRAVVFGPKTKTVPERHRMMPHEIVPNRTVAELIAGTDPQLDAAVRWLTKQKLPKR